LAELDACPVREYFARRGTVATWWAPEESRLALHYAAELRVIEEQLAIDPAWEVLDVGTGRGRFGLYFAARGCSAVGVDVNPDMLDLAREAARQRGLASRFEVRAGDAAALREFEDARFDVVVCMELFDHLPDLGGALREARRVLRPGGRLVFSYVPSESLYGALGDALRGALRRFRPDRLLISRTYSSKAMRENLAGAGLALERCWGIGLLCLNAQTRVFRRLPGLGVLDALARAEARRRPYYDAPQLARHASHLVGFAKRAADAS
jgi:2-polyprenyl-3-methyl-5-hydroxy-6-metoxy-1,4-benzoquinol methylase